MQCCCPSSISYYSVVSLFLPLSKTQTSKYLSKRTRCYYYNAVDTCKPTTQKIASISNSMVSETNEEHKCDEKRYCDTNRETLTEEAAAASTKCSSYNAHNSTSLDTMSNVTAAVEVLQRYINIDLTIVCVCCYLAAFKC